MTKTAPSRPNDAQRMADVIAALESQPMTIVDLAAELQLQPDAARGWVDRARRSGHVLPYTVLRHSNGGGSNTRLETLYIGAGLRARIGPQYPPHQWTGYAHQPGTPRHRHRSHSRQPMPPEQPPETARADARPDAPLPKPHPRTPMPANATTRNALPLSGTSADLAHYTQALLRDAAPSAEQRVAELLRATGAPMLISAIAERTGLRAYEVAAAAENLRRNRQIRRSADAAGRSLIAWRETAEADTAQGEAA